MAKSFKVYDTDSGRVISIIQRVADAQRLTSAAYTSGQSTVTVTTTASLWPGMLLIAKGVPTGTTVLSVDSATTFTMSGNATATVSAGIIIALAYLPYKADGTVVTKEIHLEHYRDLFSEAGTPMFITNDDGDTIGNLVSPGIILYPEEPEFQVATVATPEIPVSVKGVAALTMSDDKTHLAPREQIQVCSFVHFILEDGTLLPVLRKPSFDIVPVS